MPKGVEFGTIALDCTRTGNFSQDPFMGCLALVGPDNRVYGSDLEFSEPTAKQMERGRAGGIGNAANAIADVLTATMKAEPKTDLGWALMGFLGTDAAGEIFREKIRPPVETELLRTHPLVPVSGLSEIRIQDTRFETATAPAGERAIYYRAGASGETEFAVRDIFNLAKYRPINVNVSYPGLFPRGADRTNGRNLQAFFRLVRTFVPVVSMDVHSFTKPEHVAIAIPYTDMFNASLTDAARLFLGLTVTENMPETEKQILYRQIGSAINHSFLHAPAALRDHRCRLFTVTDKSGTFLIFADNNHRTLWSYQSSPAAAIPAVDKTGAGDVRFALQRLFIAANKYHEWQKGSFTYNDARLAINVGQIAAALHIQGPDARLLEGVSLPALIQAAASGRVFRTLEKLKQAVRTACPDPD